MGIVRGLELAQLEPLLETVITAGLETLEITMNTTGAAELITKACEFSKDRLMIGAGTVLNVDTLNSSLKAGASYIVMPMMEADVIAYCVENNIPVFPGALTPQEIYYAWLAGATMVKIFPTKAVGPDYFKEIKGPFNQVKLLACGGVSDANVKQFVDNGADAIAFGNEIFKPEWLEKKQYDLIGQKIKDLIQAYYQACTQ